MNKQQFLDNIQKYIELYKSGLSLKAVSENAGFTSKRSLDWVSKTLKENGLKLRSKSEDNRNRFGYTLKDDVFFGETLDEKSSYFLGFIIADGSLSKGYLSLTVSQKDGYILKALQELLGMNYGYRESSIFDKRTEKYYHRSTLAVKSDKLLQSLNSHNVFANKSAEEKLPNIDWMLNRHFWRGLVDGDGHVRTPKNKPAALVLVGSEEIVNGFIQFCDFNVGFITKRKAVPVQHKNKTLYHVQITGDDARNIAEFLYKDSSIHLTRKYNQALCIEEENGAYTNPASETISS